MIESWEIKNQIAIEKADILLNGPYRDRSGFLWPKGKVLVSFAPRACCIETNQEKWSA